ncbi:hemolysin III family protein [uncultured Dysosmobacter sp.]|uniref:PAQR family membrane homeostasis protein TrhA n=1 Tax=uncultured Dysosmobacter sp. TaxID=2591384 RepID=UPI002607C96C|nr:hemolysin III family protein [uncultured Dysosmobacter sp.]
MEMALSAKQYARIRRKVRTRKLNEPPRLTVGEEVFNAVSHGVGTALAITGLVLLLLRSDTPLEIMASCFYGISMVVMMSMSSVYHAMPAGSRVKRLWRRFDYTSIYLLIGGTFAPILLVHYGTSLCIALFCLQWGVILFGVSLLLAFGPGRWRPLHFTLYFLIGWSGLMFLPDLYQNGRTLLWFILAGGVVYTLGMIPFAKKGKYNHCVWHVFVLAAAVLHWMGIYTQIY